MPQYGIHLNIGLFGVGNKRIDSKLATGFFIGSILPDLDFILLVPLYFVNKDFAMSCHRSFSHSFLFLSILLTFLLTYKYFFKNKIATKVIYGIILGVILHILLDIFMWFAPVKLFWPNSFGINIIGNSIVPDIYWNIVSSLENFCYALFQREILQPDFQILCSF